jgi:5-methylcytosine-specific restriction endonuclease McrA
MAWSGKGANMGPRWAGIREKVLRNSGGICGMCGGDGAVEVDHIIPRHAGGTSEPHNLQAICRKCHGLKSARESHAVQAKKRRMRKRPPDKHPGRLYE